jgi:hypothetical protein
VKIVVDSAYEGVPEPTGGAVTALLAAALVALEAEFEAEPPDAVLVADDSEIALAAALVATKLLISLEATAEATAADSPNGRVLAQLASVPA